MKPEISIIIPTLNEENYLPNILQDLCNQTDKNFEVIIVDGKSTDKTKEKANFFNKQLELNFIQSPKRHLSFQKNLGAKKAKTNYLFFLDADSRVGETTIEKLLMHIKRENGLLYLPVIKASGNNLINRSLVKLTVISVMLLQKIGTALSIGPLIVINKNLFEKIGGFSEITSASEDHNLVIKAHNAGVQVKFLKDVICVFSMRRFETQGIGKVLVQYLIFTLETLLKGGVYTKTIRYEMGGHNFKKNSK